MLARSHRLRKSSDILRVYKKGTRGHSRHLLIHTLATRLPETRGAVIISKKVDKRAVVRNRNRRRISEIFRTELPRIQTGFDILITIKLDIRELTATELKQEVADLLRKSGVLT